VVSQPRQSWIDLDSTWVLAKAVFLTVREALVAGKSRMFLVKLLERTLVGVRLSLLSILIQDSKFALT